MRTLPLLLAGLALSFSAAPALALKDVGGCDIVALAAKDSPIAITPEQWQVYHEASEAALGLAWNPPLAADTPLTALAAAQQELLALIKASPAYQDYLASDKCRILSKPNASAIDALLAEAMATMPEDAAKLLADSVQTARIQIDRIAQTARFRSAKDLTLFAARYYCFIAAAIVAFLPPERLADLTLEDFGDTISCKDAGRV